MISELRKHETLFECLRCGDCCKGYGGTYITSQELDLISRFLNTDRAQFEVDYCKLSGNRPLLAQKADGYCIFWEGLCTIHPVKPRMCRQWPYIPAILVDVGNWFAMARSCPGMRTDVSEDFILRSVRQVLSGNGMKYSL